MITSDAFDIASSKFPDGTLKLNFYSNLEFYDTVCIAWKYKDESELIKLIYIKKHLQQTFPDRKVSLFMPYIPNARMDRTHIRCREVFTLKYFCEVINSLNFDKVYVVDPHSNVSTALLNNLVVLPIDAILDNIQRGYFANEAPVIYYPDAGAMKRYSGMFSHPPVYGNKTRDWDTGEITGLTLEGAVDLVKGKPVLIVDDICSAGGTFYHAAKALKEAGAGDISLYVTHCEETIFKGALWKAMQNDGLIDKVFTTDSIERTDDSQLHVAPISISYLIDYDE